MYIFRGLTALLTVGATGLAATGCGGSGPHAAHAPHRADAASTQRTSSQPHAHEIAYLRRQYAAFAMAPEVHVYGDGSVYLLTQGGGAGIHRENCRLPAQLLLAVRREAAALPHRDVVGPRGSGDTFLLRVDGHTAAASQTRVPGYMAAIVRQLAGVIDNQGQICTTTDRFPKP
jgi:hypothetical protein